MLRLMLPLALAAAAPAQTATLRVTARAGAVDRGASPTAGEFAWPAALAPALTALDRDPPIAWQARLLDQDGEAVPCEVMAQPATATAPARGSVRFLTVGLAAGTERTYRLELGASDLAAVDVESPFRTAEQAERRDLVRGGHAVLRHESAFDRADFERTSKPIWHLLLPGTGTVLTKGPGGQYSHHRGLFLGWNKTTVGDATFDFWHCAEAGQRHTGFDLTREVRSSVRGDFAAGTHWLSPLDETVVRERRIVTVWESARGTESIAPTVLDVAIELSADRAIALRGDPQHAGFQLRVADEVAQRKDARYVRPATAKANKNDVWADCPWVAGLFTIAGQDVAIAHMSHPDNPQPTVYSTRDYGRFGAYFTADITSDAPLRLRYRLLVLARTDATDVSEARFARDYADFVQPVALTIE